MSWAVQAWVEKLDYRSIDIPNSRKPHHQRKGESDEAFRERRQTAAVAAEDTSATATCSCHASSAPSVSERTKRLTFAHREVLKVIADHARQNGLAWPGMDLIAKEAHISYRQAFNIVPDLELAGLLKIHKTVGGAGQVASLNGVWGQSSENSAQAARSLARAMRSR